MHFIRNFLFIFCLILIPLIYQNCARNAFEQRSPANENASINDDLESRLFGLATQTSHRVLEPNALWTGVFGFDQNSGDDFPSGTRRAQVSPDGKIWLQFNGESASCGLNRCRWEIAALKPLSAPGVVALDTLNRVKGLHLDAVQKQKIISDSSKFINDNAGDANLDFNKGLGGGLAISFNPLFAFKGIPMDSQLETCEIDNKPEFSPLDSAKYECLHLLVHQRGYFKRNGICPKITEEIDSPETWPCIMIAPLVVRLDVRNKLDPEILWAHLGKFRPIRMNYPDGSKKAVRQKINEYAATSDSGLVFFVYSAEATASEADDNTGAITYTFNNNPYLPMEISPNWVSIDWAPARSLWHIYDDYVSNQEQVRGLAGGFRKAYPMAQYPFRFANGVRIRQGLGRYQWFSPEGSGMMVNIGARAVAAVLGRESRGVIKHADSSAQLSRQNYCLNNPVKSHPEKKYFVSCDPTQLDGDLECSNNTNCSIPNPVKPEEGVRSNSNIMGIQEYTALGAATGFWSLPLFEAKGEIGEEVAPLQKRFPQWSILFNNKALHRFHPNPNQSNNHTWIYSEIAHDDFEDPNFLVFFHMNEAIFGRKGTGHCDFGSFVSGAQKGTFCDLAVFSPFENNDADDEPFAADTSRNTYLGRLGGTTKAKFPFDYWKNRGIGERIQGNAEQTGEVNPGFKGRAVHFAAGSFIKIDNEPNLSTKIIESKREMTIELAIRLAREFHPATKNTSSKESRNYTGILGRQKGSWELSFATGKLQFSAKNESGDFETVQMPDSLELNSETWNHVIALVKPSQVDIPTSPLNVSFFINGAKVFSSKLTRVNKLIALPQASSEYLCVGPGCSPDADSTEIWLDEFAISSVARPITYLKAAANSNFKIRYIDAERSTVEFPKLVGFDSFKGLDTLDIRIPKLLLDLYGNDKTKFSRIVQLGRALFHDPILSTSQIGKHNHRACSSCHAENTGFTSPHHLPKDMGLNSAPLKLNSPTILNRAFSIRQFLDERSPSVLNQAAGPIANPLEMGGKMDLIMDNINGKGVPSPAINQGPFINVPTDHAITHPIGVPNYKRWFCFAMNHEVFKQDPTCGGKEWTAEDLLAAVATYELAQLASDSAVDRMKAGEPYKDSLAYEGGIQTSIKEGYQIFIGKGRCVGCHSGKNYSDELLHQNGPLDSNGSPLKIKTPTLRQLTKTFPYFHDGSNGFNGQLGWCQFEPQAAKAGYQLCQVVEFYNRGACRMTDSIKLRAYSGPTAMGKLETIQVPDVACDLESVSLGLSAQEKRNLVEFLRHL